VLRRKRGAFLIYYIFINSFFLFTNERYENYPLIKTLNFSDVTFKQYTEDVEIARKTIKQGKIGDEVPIKFYRYRVEKGWDIISIIARCCVDNAAIITLNRIQSPKDNLVGTYILLPTTPGIYLPEMPENPLEKLEAALCEKEAVPVIEVNIKLKKGDRKVLCIPNGQLDGTAWTYFLNPLYRFPLDSGILTSSFGKRPSPFTGKPSYHPGIDLAAPTGSPVYACAPGKVKKVTYNKVYGNYIIIKHNDGRESLYGHLSKTLVTLNQVVKAGTIIGKVGSTGMSTGPHLHFEIREKGIATDPQVFIKNVK